jgi:predicted transcriptional regulator of viral defense system
MKYENLIELFKERPFFESGEIIIAFDEPRPQIEARLSRWVAMGKLVKLRQEKYLLPKKYRSREPSLEYISNYLYRPSYISLRTALSIYGMLPEAVHIKEAVTPRKTAVWKTSLCTFKYYSIKKERFWGYKIYPDDEKGIAPQNRFFLAEPEKVLLDLFYLLKGEWTKERIKEMRFQNLESIKRKKLCEYSEKFESPKVSRAVRRFADIYLKGK